MGSLGVAVSFLVLFPFVAALVLAFAGNNSVRKAVVYVSCALIAAVAVIFAGRFFLGGSVTLGMLNSSHLADKLMLAGEFFLMVLVIVLSFKHKKYYAAVLSAVQTVAVACLEISGGAESETAHILADRLSVVMCLIIGIVGCLICVYAVGYMTEYHNHHKEYKDRRLFFFPMLFVFLGAMFGLVLSDNLIWIYFFWEITSVTSFLLIGYTKTEEAINNSFRALWMNLLGGVGFAAAIIILSFNGIHNLSEVIKNANGAGTLFVAAVALLGFAGLTKSAQMPFSKWLLGAMVAPTPTSALLHSATMVKAGVYLLLRLAPALCGNVAGYMIAFVGGFTFIVTSMLAITQSDGKKILAYSTISNLGLITACAGIGTAEAVWAGVLLMMFHAVSKSMLFQTVGAVENSTGSRDVEDMHGLIVRLPHLAMVMVVGICGMFLAPFGMLISKWAVLKSFIDSNSAVGILLVFFICFGSATTMFYWTKWLCKILAFDLNAKPVVDRTIGGQWVSLALHAFMMIALLVILPLVSSKLLVPYVCQVFNMEAKALGIISVSDILIMVVMLFAIIAVPILAKIRVNNLRAQTGMSYMSGINKGDNATFTDSFGGEKKAVLSGWYLTEFFGESRLWNPSVIISAACIAVCIVFALLTGGAF